MPTTSVHVRLLLRDLSASFARYDAQQKHFRLRGSGAAVSCVRVQGVCTSATLSEPTCKLEIGAAFCPLISREVRWLRSRCTLLVLPQMTAPERYKCRLMHQDCSSTHKSCAQANW